MEKEGNKVTYHFQIPANTRADVRILAPAGAQIKEGGKVVKASVTPTGLQTELGSGTYHWVVE